MPILANEDTPQQDDMVRDARLRVCVVTDTFPKLSETFVRDQVAGLLRAGVEVEVFADKVSASSDRSGPIAVRERWGPVSKIEPWLRSLPPTLSDRAITGFDRVFARRLLSFDAVIAHFGMNGVRVARTGHRMPGFPPLITVFHGFDVGMPAHDGTTGQYHPLFAFPGLFLTVNRPFREMLVASGAPPDRTRTHHLGIRPEAIPFRTRSWTGRMRILTVGRLTEKKGTAQALQALAQLAKTSPEKSWTFEIIGDGERRGDLEQLAADLGIGGQVRFLGARSHAQVRQAMNEADIFLLPSLTASTGDMEGLPIVLMEAMSAGLLVVSTRHSGIPELVRDGENGVLADEGDVDGLFRRLDRIFDHRDELPILVSRGRRTIETEFHADRQSQELIEWLWALKAAGQTGLTR